MSHTDFGEYEKTTEIELWREYINTYLYSLLSFTLSL